MPVPKINLSLVKGHRVKLSSKFLVKLRSEWRPGKMLVFSGINLA